MTIRARVLACLEAAGQPLMVETLVEGTQAKRSSVLVVLHELKLEGRVMATLAPRELRGASRKKQYMLLNRSPQRAGSV
jgi:hypothetical protein